MKPVDPRMVVDNNEVILTRDGDWPNFHDAEIIDLHITRGDVRPEDNVYISPHIITHVQLCALENPIIATLKFEDCYSISLSGFNHQNPIMDLHFAVEERGMLKNGKPMTPCIVVRFEPVWEFRLSFKCFRASVIEVVGRITS